MASPWVSWVQPHFVVLVCVRWWVGCIYDGSLPSGWSSEAGGVWHGGFPGGASGEEPACPCRRHNETRIRSLGREDPLEEDMATHSRILAWRIPWTQEPGGLVSMGSQRVGHNWGNLAHSIVMRHKTRPLRQQGPWTSSWVRQKWYLASHVWKYLMIPFYPSPKDSVHSVGPVYVRHQ